MRMQLGERIARHVWALTVSRCESKSSVSRQREHSKNSRRFQIPAGHGLGNKWQDPPPRARTIPARIFRLGRDLETLSELSEAPTDNASACAVPTSRASPGQGPVT